MNNDEFAEYKAVIRYALDEIGFNERVDIIKLAPPLASHAIYIVSQRDRNVSALITPRGQEFNIQYFNCGMLDTADVVNLAAPDSLIALGALLSDHLKVKYGRSKSGTNLK